MVIARSAIWIPILWFAVLVEGYLALPMSTVDGHERLSLCLEHVLRSVFVPPVDEIAVETVSISDLWYMLAYVLSSALQP